ncbi:uncharacterized protein B0I36DRAFT_249893 [Microdochium trichocladiopsis]|uniref:Letm1 RBD domain-containing protein n=1 Tax=Microdochium trichocladiopsis TaxID=1682393 RepID=A0A9P8XYS7_9PEZI|nr:uncharacterized protein B0I36DRAFT_249893 [Microdochium trichocladiopsis]KAH7025276.1 hypothetical protein B0I36DRAFT_249893 [Microdochium trichocladiopsis]
MRGARLSSYSTSVPRRIQPNTGSLVLRPVTAARLYADQPAAKSVGRLHSSARSATVTATAAAEEQSNVEAVAASAVSSPAANVTWSSVLNPPDSTRPPALDLPVRKPKQSLAGHLLRLGKAYGSFYRSGLKAVLINRRLVSQLKKKTNSNSGKDTLASTITRADLLLRERTRHDFLRLPLFGLVVLLTGEFSPLVVLLFPKLTPYTCRIPSHVAKLRRAAHERRLRSYQKISSAAAAVPTDAHLARVLGIGFALWDRVGLAVPLASRRVDKLLREIVQDDFRIRSGGGVELLHPDEVALAAERRGQDVRDRSTAGLRSWLRKWVDDSTQSGAGSEEDGVMAARERLAVGKSV